MRRSKEYVKPRHKSYTLAKRVNGQLYCYIDESMVSMAWSKEACYVYLSEKAPKLSKKQRQEGVFVIRIHSNNSPIDVDLSKRWPKRTRNHIFTLKKTHAI